MGQDDDKMCITAYFEFSSSFFILSYQQNMMQCFIYFFGHSTMLNVFETYCHEIFLKIHGMIGTVGVGINKSFLIFSYYFF